MKTGIMLLQYFGTCVRMLFSVGTMVCIDDKHRLKVGEPEFPMATAERGQKVIVRAGTTFEVGDHGFY